MFRIHQRIDAEGHNAAGHGMADVQVKDDGQVRSVDNFRQELPVFHPGFAQHTAGIFIHFGQPNDAFHLGGGQRRHIKA